MNARFTGQVDCGGVTSYPTINRTGTVPAGIDDSLSVGWAGTLSTRSTTTAGTLTMTNAAHTIGTGSKIDIFWADGSCYHATVGTVVTTSVPFTLANGDVLPNQGTAIVACNPTNYPLSVDGDTIQMLHLYTSARGRVTALDGSDDPIADMSWDLAAGEGLLWYDGAPSANPLAATVPESFEVSNGDAVNASTIKCGFQLDS